jgi:hypothetical protein
MGAGSIHETFQELPLMGKWGDGEMGKWGDGKMGKFFDLKGLLRLKIFRIR